jgi:hypothetical protein
MAPDSTSRTRLTLTHPLDLTATPDRRTFRARLIRAGRVRYADNSPGPFHIPAEALIDAQQRGMFNGISTFVDHADWFANSSLRNLAGLVVAAEWNDDAQGIDAAITLYETPAGQLVEQLFSDLLADAAAGRPTPDVGLSLVFWPNWQNTDPLVDEPLTLASFRHIESCDFVFQPAADGRVLAALAALSAQPPTERIATMPQDAESTPTPSPTHAEPWQRALQQATTEALIASSGLPATSLTWLRSQTWDTPDELTGAIAQQRALLAELTADSVVSIGGQPPRGSRISVGRSSIEQIEAATLALLAGALPPPGVQPLTGIRELYHLLSGDYEMTGVFQSDRLQFANVTSSTMAALVANALNKVVVTMFQSYPAWWLPLVTEMDFTNLQDARWITLGGVGELPTVPEGGAYTELTWDDKTETSAFVKKGGYLGITLETIDKDDTGRVRAAPRALAQAAWMTLGKAIARIFTANGGVGPTMSDSYALFHSNHNNLGTSALTWATYVATRTLMMKQAELNSGERLGALTRPRFLIVPIDLEMTAMQLLASEGEPGTGDNDVNPLAAGYERESRLAAARARIVTCPFFTDVNDWALQADPNLYPSIGLGYRYGRTPELFSVASPTAGLMFTNDTLPVKVRFYFAAGPTDFRGLYKHNVAGGT